MSGASLAVQTALVAVLRLVAGDEILQVVKFQRAGFQREMVVGAQVIKPHVLGMHLAVFRLGIKKHHIRLHALGVKNAGRQAQHGVNVAGFE